MRVPAAARSTAPHPLLTNSSRSYGNVASKVNIGRVVFSGPRSAEDRPIEHPDRRCGLSVPFPGAGHPKIDNRVFFYT